MLHKITTKQKILVMIAVMSGLLLAALDQSIVGTALPTIVAQFNGLSELSWVVTAYLLTSTITIPISGKMSDIFGRRKVLLTGILIFVLGSSLTGAAWNMTSLIFFRALQGIGGGVLFASAFAVIGDLFAPAERAKWQGIFGAVFGLSSIIGPLLGGFLTDNVSWRWCFYINIPFGILAFILIYFFLPTIVAKGRDKKIDYGGAAILAFALGSLLLGLSWGGTKYPWLSWEIISLMIGALILIPIFIYWEAKHEDPIIPLHIFKNSIFRVSVTMLFFVGIAMFGAIIYLPMFAQIVQGSSATNSGIILLPLVVSLAATSIISGQVISRTGRYKILAIAGTIITTVALFWLSTLTASSSHAQTIIRMIPLGIGIGIIMPLFNLIVQNAFPQKMLGVVSSSAQLFRGIGSVVGIAVMGTYLNHSIAQKLESVGSSSFIEQLKQSRHLTTIDANSMEQILSKESQAKILSQLSDLPQQLQAPLINSFNEFVRMAQTIMAGAITNVFFLGGCIMLIACLVVFFLKEIPLRKSNDLHHDMGH
jgi:EmrB/QacA subfamily drug resistance transporter